MRVWVYPEKTYEEMGAERWVAQTEVVPANWAALTEDQREHFDRDDFQMKSWAFTGPTAYESARSKAKSVIDSGQTVYGSVILQRQVVNWYVEEDRVAEWVDVGETEYVE